MVFAALFGASHAAAADDVQPAQTYYVRVDGGDALQCDGRSDAPYPGSGRGQACAWRHPMIALPAGQPARIGGGDTLRIRPGSYMVGLGAPGAERCSPDWPWDCGMGPIPSGMGPDRRTRIIGGAGEGACSKPTTELWGTERVGAVLRLNGTRHAEVACLEVTDHSSCVEFHGGPRPTSLTCKRDAPPFGPWAATGLVMLDASDIVLRDLDIHGLAHTGVSAGRVRDLSVTNVRIAGNGWVGWDGDVSGGNKEVSSSNSGTLRFSKWLVEWNGCAETYPGRQPTGCWAQSAGGYGDGVGTGVTGGRWVIEDSIFRFNTSDGLDLLYHNGNGSITLNRVWAEGNAGNQIKLTGRAAVTNTVVVGRCGHFSGQPFTLGVDACRAGGDALVLNAHSGSDLITVVNSTVFSEGNVTILVGGAAEATFVMRNNILVGWPMFLDPSRNSADIYSETRGVAIDEQYALKDGVRRADCRSPFTLCGPSGLLGTGRSRVDPRPGPGSRALDSGMPVGGVIPDTDYRNRRRPMGTGVDRGAFEGQ